MEGNLEAKGLMVEGVMQDVRISLLHRWTRSLDRLPLMAAGKRGELSHSDTHLKRASSTSRAETQTALHSHSPSMKCIYILKLAAFGLWQRPTLFPTTRQADDKKAIWKFDPSSLFIKDAVSSSAWIKFLK
jgi:hypothetical protein